MKMNWFKVQTSPIVVLVRCCPTWTSSSVRYCPLHTGIQISHDWALSRVLPVLSLLQNCVASQAWPDMGYNKRIEAASWPLWTPMTSTACDVDSTGKDRVVIPGTCSSRIPDWSHSVWSSIRISAQIRRPNATDEQANQSLPFTIQTTTTSFPLPPIPERNKQPNKQITSSSKWLKNGTFRFAVWEPDMSVGRPWLSLPKIAPR